MLGCPFDAPRVGHHGGETRVRTEARSQARGGEISLPIVVPGRYTSRSGRGKRLILASTGNDDTLTTRIAQAQGKETNKALFYFALCLIVFGTMTGVMMVPALLVEIANDLEVSVAVAGQLATATFAAWAVSIVAVGPLADSVGRRPMALAGVLLVVASLLASALAPNIETMMALRVLAGLGGGAIAPTSIGVISDVISQGRRAQAIGGIASTIVLTSAISIPLVALFADWWGWRWAFVLSGLFLAGVWLLNWVVYPRDNRERVRGMAFFGRYWSLLSLNYFRLAVTVNVTQRMAYWSLLSFFAAYLIQTYEVSVGFVALPLVITALGQVAGSYIAGMLATKRYRVILVSATSAAGGVCSLAFFAFDIGLWPAVAVATVGSGLLSVTTPVLLAGSTEYSGESKATGASLIGFSNQSGGVFGAGLSGALLATMGYAGIGYLCIVFAVAGAVVAMAFARPLRVGTG